MNPGSVGPFLGGPGNGLRLQAEEAALIPTAAVGFDIQAEPDCLLLLAAPGL